MSLTCPTCQQPMPGMDEPPDVGTVVSCICGEAFARHRLKPKPDDPRYPRARVGTGPWRKIGGQAGGQSWINLAARHAGPGHALTVIHRPASAGPS